MGSSIFRVNDEVSRGSEVPLRAFCCKARGGGGHLRHATEIEDKEKRKEEKKQEEKIREEKI